MAPKFQKGPDLKRFMDKRLRVSLNGNRKIIGTLRGYDAFLNVVLEGVENGENGQYLGQVVVRGSSLSNSRLWIESDKVARVKNKKYFTLLLKESS